MPAASQTLFPASASSGGNSASSSLSLNSLDNMDAANHAFNHHASHQGLVGVGGGHHGLSVGGGHGASRGGGAQGAQSHSHQGHAGQFAGRHHSFTLPSSSSSSSSSNPACTSSFEESRTVQLALELAMLQGQQAGLGGNPLVDSPTANLHHSHHSHGLNGGGLSGVNGGSSGLMSTHHSDNPLLHPFNSSQFPNHGSLEDLKARRSQNMTECVPVPTSEHVAEIVGRQGCKIKALRTKTNTYIKTPVRGEEPVFVVTGRKEDVALAKREILSAAEHFSQIRASRTKNSINSTLAFGQLVANQPGQTTVQVRVPYRVVGLVVGPKGATIKRIQQQTHTYIVTPSRDKEPVFDVTGLPENVEAARKEIEAHIAMRTGNDNTGGSMNGLGLYNMDMNGMDDHNGFNGYSSSSAFSSSGLDGPLGSGNNLSSTSSQNKFNSILNGGGTDSAFSSLASSGNSGKGIILQNILDGSNNFGVNDSSLHLSGNGIARNVPWSNGGGDSHDSGIGSSPPFDRNGHHSLFDSIHHDRLEASNGTAIWGDINKLLGNLDLDGPSSNSLRGRNNGGPISRNILNHHNPLTSNLLNTVNRFPSTGSNNGDGQDFLNGEFTCSSNSSDMNNHHMQKPFNLNVGSRSSLDLGSLGRPSASIDSSSNNTAKNSMLLLSSGEVSPPLSLPYSSSNGSSNGHAHLQHRASVSSEPSGILFHDQELNNLTDGICNEVGLPSSTSSKAFGHGAFDGGLMGPRSSSSSNLFSRDDQVIVGSRLSPSNGQAPTATKDDDFLSFANK